jgi:hypothetical protein
MSASQEGSPSLEVSVVTLPGFGAESSLRAFKRRGAGTSAADTVRDIVYPAQFRLEGVDEWWKRSGVRYVNPDCPLGQRAILVCEWRYPIYECTFTGGGNYECHIKSWKCGFYRPECRPLTLQVAA